MSRYLDARNSVLESDYDEEERRRLKSQALYSQYAQETQDTGGGSRYAQIRDELLRENPQYGDPLYIAQQARRNAESAAAFAQQASNKDQHMQHLKDQVQLASEIRGGDYSHMNEFNRLHNGDQEFNPVRGRDAHEELKKKTREDALDVLDEYYARKQYGDDEYDRMQAAMPQMQKRYDELDKKLHAGEELPPEIQAAKDRLDEAERTGEGYDPMDMDEDMRIVSEYRMENPKKSGLTQEEEYEYNQLSMELLSYGERAAIDKIAELSNQLSNISNVNSGAYMQEQQKKNQQLQAQIDEQAEILKEYGWDDKKINEYRLRGERLLHREKAKEEKAIIPIDENDSALVKGIKSVGDYTLARVANMTAPLSVMSNFEERPEGQGRDPYSSWGAPRRAAQLSDQEVLDKVIGEDNTIGRMAYSAAASAGDAAIVMLATKGAGELFGVAGAGMALETAEKAGTATAAMRHAATAEKVIQNLFMAPYIASGYESGYEEARANGASEEGAQLRGFISGFAEYATEKVSLDNLWEIANGTKAGRNILVNLFVSAGIEGSEEVASDVINEWADAAISAALKDKKSDYQQRVDDYLAQGYSEEEANKKAAAEKVAEYMYDGMVGAMSGGMMGVGAAARGYSVANENKQRSKEVSEYYGKQAENITGDTEYEQGSKAQAEKYAQNPTQYLADSIDDTTKAGREAKELIQEYADKEAEGKRLSASDRADIERALYEADAAAQFKDRSSMDVYEGYTRELQQVPKEYRTASTGITEEQARTRLVEAAKSGDLQGLSDTYQAMKNAMSPDLREHADEIYKQYYGMAENNGVSEQQLNALKQTPQDAYLAGLKGESRESLGAISTVAAEAYNAGAQQRIRNNTFQVDKADNLKMVKLSDGNTRSLSGQFDAEGDIVTTGGTVSIASIENDSVREAYTRASAQPTAAAQQAYIENIKDGTNLHSYDIAFNNLYRAGVTGVSFDRAKKDLRVYISGLGEDMSRSIFDTGASDYRAEISRKASDGVRSAFKMRKGSGAFQDLRQGAKADIDTRVMDLTAKATGLNVVLIDATGDNRQAWFDAKASTIYVTEDHAVQLIHEMGEFAEIYAPEEYEQLRGAVMAASENMLGSAGYQSMIDNYYQAYKNVEADKTVLEASEEATNDMLVALMSTDKGQQALAKYLTEKLGVKEAKTVGQKIKDFFQGIVNSMKSLLNSSKLNSYQKKMLDAKIAEEEELIDSFIKTLDKAIENYQSAQESESGKEVEVKNSVDVTMQNAAENVKNHDYSYDALVAKPDIKIFSAHELKLKELAFSSDLRVKDIVDTTRENIKKYNKGTDYGEKQLFNKDLGALTTIGSGGIKHGLERIKRQTVVDARTALPAYFENAIVFNEAAGRRDGAETAYILFGVLDNGDDLSLIRMIVNHYMADNRAHMSPNSLYAVNVNKEEAVLNRTPAATGWASSSSLTISQLMNLVKRHFPKDVSSDVASHLSYKRERSDIEGLKYSLSVDSDGNELSPGQQEYFKDESPLLLDENGALKRYYHGTARKDRVGTVFDPARATSGPMAFFTDDKKIAENYSKDKSDTSISRDERYDSYYTQFRLNIGGKDLSLPEAWNKLPVAKKNEIRNKAEHVTLDYDDTYEIIYDKNNRYGLGNLDAYTLNAHKGNYLEALIESWLENGELYGHEGDFLDVLKLVGIEDATYLDPNFRDEGVYEVYLHVTNPLNTSDISGETMEKLRAAAQVAEENYEEPDITSDMWDKNTKRPAEWMERLEGDEKDGTSHSWTSIPDWVTDTLKKLGYDGIVDKGGKYHEVEHQVVIPFSSEQVKNIDNLNPTDNPDIRYSMNIDDTLQYLDSLVDPKRSSGFNNTIRFLGVTRSQETLNFYMDSAREMLGRGTISQEEYDLLDAFSMKKRMALMKQDSPEARYSLNIDEDWESDFWSQPAPEEKVGGVKLSELGSILQDGMTELMGQIVDEKKVREIATKLRTEVGSTIKVNEFSDMLMKAFAYMQAQDHVDYADVMRIFNEIARPVVDQITTIDEGAQYAYDNFVDALKGQKIRLTSKQEAEVKNAYGNLANFRRATMPLDFSRKGTIDLDSLWPSLVDELGGLIDADAAEGDQPLIIADTLASLRPSPFNPYGMNTEEYARDLAMRIVEEYLGMQAGNEARGAAKKFAEKGKQYRERVRNRYEERFKEAKAQLREKVRDQILKIQDDNIEKMAELRARNRKDAQRIRDAVEIRHQKEMITKKAKKLATWVMDPTDKNHVPQELQEPVLEFLYALDFVEPDVIYKKGDPQGEYQAKILNHTIIDEFGRRHLVFDTIKADTREGAIWEFYNRLHAGMGSQAQRSWTERMQRLQDLLNRVKGGDQFEHADMDSIAQMFDTDLADELADMLARNRGKASINSLSVKEFQLLNKALDHIAHAIDNSNKAITMNEEIEGLAVNTITHAQALKQPKNHSSAYNKITKNIGVDMMTPETFFALQGDSGEKIYHALTDALNRKILDVKETEAYMKEALRKVNKKDMRKMRREVHSFNVHDGVIELTTAQIMSMYELNKRDQAVLHYRGGVKADTVRVKNKGITHEQNQSRAVHLSPFDIAEIVGILTDEQKALADKMQKFLAGRCAEWGNEASLKMYGYQKFEDPNYFPITTDKSTIAKNNANTSKQSLNGIEHMGMTKKVNEFAKNPILIRDIFDVFTDHITDMAAYHGYAPVVKDANRWFNYKEIFPENGRDDGGFLDYVTVQQAINTNIGRTDNEGVNYYTKLVQDINGQEKSGEISTFWDSLIGNYKAAAVAGNLRVVIQQPTAFMRAFNMINPKYMIASLPSAVTAGKNIKRIKELSPIAWWKSQGYYESSMGKSVASIVTGEESVKDQIVDKSMWLAGKADDITWSILYKAVEKEQKAMAKGEDISEEEYRRRVNDRFDDAIAQTQVVDVIIQKSQWMRATGGLTKMRTAFMAEPTKSYNMALKAIIEDHRTYGNNIAKWKSVRKAAVVLLLTDMLTSVAQSLMDAIRYKDDDDEYLDLLVDYFQSNMIDNINPLNRIPGLKDVSDSLWSAFLGESKYGSSSGQSFDAASTEAAIEAISTFSKQMQGTYSKTGYAAYMSYTKALSRITGIPLYNISRDGAAFWNLFAEGDNRLIKNIPKPSDKYQGIYNALDRGKSDEALYAAIDKAMNENGTVKSAESFLQSKYKQDYLDLLDTNPDAAEELAEEAVRAYMGLGLTRPEAEEEIESWSDPSYGYSVLDKAIENKDGEGIEDAVRYLQEAKDDDKIIEHVLNAYGTTINYNRKHKAGTAESTIEQNVNRALKTVDRSIDFDSAYRDQQLKEKEKAEKKAAQAEKKAAQTTVYETITTGSGDYKAAVDAWAREGVDASSMKSSLTSDQVKPAVKAYKQGDRNAQQTLTRVAMTKAYIDEQSGLEIPKKYGGDYYTYELDQITKMMDKYDKEPW